MDSRLTFREYQSEAARTDRARGGEVEHLMVPLLGLAGEAGSLLAEFKKWIREGDRYKPFTDQVSEEIGDILWYLANIAGKTGLDLEEIAHENLAKLANRWPNDSQTSAPLFETGPDRYDAAFDEAEKLPLAIRVEFRHVMRDGSIKLEAMCNGQPFGDPLTDNAHSDDGYRFHDVFHLANTVLLGWSPIVRRLLKVKRKSNPRIDEVEDGARAAITEEAISALVFGYAKDYSFFDGCVSVDYDILRTIKVMTRPFEVRDKSFRDWENVILEGFCIWRKMKANGGGVFVGDASRRVISYEELPQEPSAE